MSLHYNNHVPANLIELLKPFIDEELASPSQATRWYIPSEYGNGDSPAVWVAETSSGIMPYKKIHIDIDIDAEFSLTQLFTMSSNKDSFGEFDISYKTIRDISKTIYDLGTEHIWMASSVIETEATMCWAVKLVPLLVEEKSIEQTYHGAVDLEQDFDINKTYTMITNPGLEFEFPSISIKEFLTDATDIFQLKATHIWYMDPTFAMWIERSGNCLLYTSPSPRDRQKSRMPSSA